MAENESKIESGAHTRCPECGKLVSVEAGFITWCECGWNLKPQQAKDSGGPLNRLYSAIGRVRGRAIFNRLSTAPQLYPRFSILTGLLFLSAIIVQLFALTLLLSGAYLVVVNYTSPFLILFGLGLITFGVSAFPRFGEIPADCIKPDKYPELHRIVNRIASLLNTSPPLCVLVDSRFNAAVSRRSWRQEKVLVIGLPLFSVLNKQERIALIAHELAHFVNGDPTRGLFISITLRALSEWHRLLHRDHFWPRAIYGRGRYRQGGGLAGGIANVAEFLSNVLLHLLSFIPYLFLWILIHLSWDEQQRAEYLADQIGAQVSGTDSFISMIEKLLFSSRVRLAAQKAALNADSRDAIKELQEEFERIAHKEFERMRRLAEMEEIRLDANHPPTAFRIKLLKAREFREPKLELGENENTALTEELSSFKKVVNRRLMDEYLRTLYR